MPRWSQTSSLRALRGASVSRRSIPEHAAGTDRCQPRYRAGRRFLASFEQRMHFDKEAGMTKLRLLGALVAGLAAASAAQATVPGKNGPILFLHQVGKYEQLFSASADGTHVRQLTHFTDSGAADASWSADGRRIAFSRDFQCCGPKEHLDIYTMNADGTGARGMGLKGLNGNPTWFPDGRRLLFGHPGGLWVLAAAGGTPRLAVKIPGDFESPTLSPNGKRAAYVRNRSNDSALFVADIGTGAVKQVTPWSLRAKPKIDWSPDGTLLVSRTEAGAVFTVHVDGSGLKTLVRGENYCSESFSPDGTKVIYIDHCDVGAAKGRLYTMSLDGTGVRRIPNVIGHWVSWGPAR
jgi:Tol biopolymer transport system component